MKRETVLQSALLAALAAGPLCGCGGDDGKQRTKDDEQHGAPNDPGKKPVTGPDAEKEGYDFDKDGVVDDLDGDLDGDGLSNRKELEIGTDPMLADTDGDKYDDGQEFKTNPRLDPNRPFHPLIADIPQIRVEILKTPSFYLTTTEGQSSSESITISEGESIDRERSSSYGNARSFGHQANLSLMVGYEQELEVGVTKFGSSFTFSSQFTAGYSFSTEETYSFDQAVRENISQRLDTARQTEETSSREISGARITGALRLYNAGNIAVNVENLNAAYAHLNSNGKVTEARSMQYEGGTLNFTAQPGKASSPISFYVDIQGAQAALAMAEDMARAGSIRLMVDSMLLTNETGGNFTDVYTNLKSRSARVMIDPGPTFKVGGHNDLLDKHVVATPRFDAKLIDSPSTKDPYVDTTLADLLKVLSKDVVVKTRTVDGEARFGITAVDGVAEDLASDSFWLVALETQRPGVNGTLYFGPFGSYDPADIFVLPGDTLQLIYSVDKDKDGVPARIELSAGSSDANADSDGDGVPDQLEIFGWCKVNGVPVLGLVDSDGRASGKCAQAGQQVIFTRPDQADTDGDGLDDFEDDRPLERARFTTAGVARIAVIHNRGEGEPPAPAAGQTATPPAFTLSFDGSHLAASAPAGIDGVYTGGSVATNEPGVESVIREEHISWAVQTQNRAAGVFVTGPKGGTPIALARDDANAKNFVSAFEGIEIALGLGQTWTVELLPEEAAANCGYAGTYKAGCEYEVYQVVLDSAPGFARTYYAAALNGEGEGWENNRYQGDANRYHRTLGTNKDGWLLTPNFRGATDGRIEAAFFVMCETSQQLETLHAKAFGVQVTDLTSWTSTNGSLLDGVAGCRWSFRQAEAVAPTDGRYDWDWTRTVFGSKRRHTYPTRLYTVGRDLDGNYIHSVVTRNFKSVDPVRMRITTHFDKVEAIQAKRWCALVNGGSWCEDEDEVRFRAKLQARAGGTTTNFSEFVWWGRSDQWPSDSYTAIGHINASSDMDSGDVMASLRGDASGAYIDAYFPACDITPSMSPRSVEHRFPNADLNFKGQLGVTFTPAGEDRSCLIDWQYSIRIRMLVNWEASD